MSDTKQYVFDVDDGTAEAGRYPADKPYITRDQGLYEPSDLDRVIIGDVADVLRAAGFTTEADLADGKYQLATSLGTDDPITGWRADDESVENVTWLREEAENIEHVHVEWVADAGTVEITIADYWEDMDEDTYMGCEDLDATDAS